MKEDLDKKSKEEKYTVFMTVTGYLSVSAQKLVFTSNKPFREGEKNIYDDENAYENRTSRKNIILFLFPVSITIFTLAKGGHVWGVLFLLFPLSYLIYRVVQFQHESLQPVILREHIISIVYKNEIPGITRARIRIRFYDDEKEIKTRTIKLPSMAIKEFVHIENIMNTLNDSMPEKVK